MSHMSRLATEIQEQGNDMIDESINERPIRRAWTDGPPLIVPATGMEAEKYSRFSKYDQISSLEWLGPWDIRTHLDGVAADPALLDAWREARAAGADRSTIARLTTTIKRAGGGFVKSDRGTAVHEWTEKVWRDRSTVVPIEFALAVAAIFDALDAAGLEIVDMERFVVDDKRRMAGTFDMIVRDADGDLYILDIKTGSLYPITNCLQLGGYSRAPYYFTQGVALDGSEDVRTPKPEVSHDVAYIAQVDIDAGTCKIIPVDISLFDYLADLNDEIIKARDANTLGKPISKGSGRSATLAKVDAYFPGTVDVTEVDDAWRTWIADRLRAAIVAGVTTIDWPEGVPTLKSGDPILLEHADLIETMVSQLETDHGLEFPDFKPGTEPVPTPRPAPVARRPKPDEGGSVTQDDVEHLNARAKALDADGRAWLGATLSACTAAKRNIRLNGPGGKLTERRYAISVALVLLGAHADDDLTRALVGIAIDDELQPGHDLGDAIGSLTIDEAKRLARLASAIDDLTITATWSFDGVEIAGDIQSALAA